MTQSGHRHAKNLDHFLGVTALIIPVGIVCPEPFNDKIDKHADLGRQMTALWKDSVKNLRRHAVLIEQMDKSPVEPSPSRTRWPFGSGSGAQIGPAEALNPGWVVNLPLLPLPAG